MSQLASILQEMLRKQKAGALRPEDYPAPSMPNFPVGPDAPQMPFPEEPQLVPRPQSPMDLQQAAPKQASPLSPATSAPGGMAPGGAGTAIEPQARSPQPFNPEDILREQMPQEPAYPPPPMRPSPPTGWRKVMGTIADMMSGFGGKAPDIVEQIAERRHAAQMQGWHEQVDPMRQHYQDQMARAREGPGIQGAILHNEALKRKLAMMASGGGGTEAATAHLGQLSEDEQALLGMGHSEATMKGDNAPLLQAVERIVSNRSITGRSPELQKRQIMALSAKAGITPDMDSTQVAAGVRMSTLTDQEKQQLLGFLNITATPSSQISRMKALNGPRWRMAEIMQGRLDLQTMVDTGQLPTVQMRNRAQMSSTVTNRLPELEGLILEADKRNLLGPIYGHYAQFVAGNIGTVTGNKQDDFLMGQLRAMLSLYETGVMNVHYQGRGGIEARNAIREDIGQLFSSKDMLLGGLGGANSFLKGYIQAGLLPELPNVPQHGGVAEPIKVGKQAAPGTPDDIPVEEYVRDPMTRRLVKKR